MQLHWYYANERRPKGVRSLELSMIIMHFTWKLDEFHLIGIPHLHHSTSLNNSSYKHVKLTA